jgi:putative methylase
MKKKELEIYLQKIPSFKKPKPGLEQYVTSAGIVADIIFIAFQMGDIKNKIVIDLGCGTGIFSVGAYIAGAKKAIGIDLDKDAIKTAKKFANENKLNIEYFVKDIKDVDILSDTIIMNPPFGAQKSNINADRRFIEKAFEKANVIYSLHLTKTLPFIEKIVASLKGNINFTKEYRFPIKHTQYFHTKKVVFFDVTLIRLLTKVN